MGNKTPVPVADRLTSGESLFFPSVLGQDWKTIDPDVRWQLADVVNHIFPRSYQARSHDYAVKLLDLALKNPGGLDKNVLSSFLEANKIPAATAYNVIIPKLVRFGLLERRRETNVSSPSKGWFLILKPSQAFATHLTKLAAEWRSAYKTAVVTGDRQKDTT